MRFFHRDVLENLLKPQSDRCISIFLPTHRTGRQTRQDPIRLKNLLDDVADQLASGGVRTPNIDKLTSAAARLVDDRDFWQHQTEGLCLFGADGHWEHFHLPYAPPEIASVGSEFQIVPLLPLIAADGLYYVLAVSLQRPRLFVGAHTGLVEWETPKLEFGMDEALALDMERQLQFHSHQRAPRNGNGPATAVYHGHEDANVDHYVREYMRRIDQTLAELLPGETAPLIFAGVDYLFPLFQDANSYPQLLPKNIRGNFDDAPPRDLEEPAREILQPVWERDKQDALSKFHAAMGTGKASDELTELLPAAENGRIDTLFIRREQPRWGRYDHAAGEVRLDETSLVDNDDLINRLAVQTLRNGGTVYTLGDDEEADIQDVAAAFRFAAVEPPAEVQNRN